MSQSFLISNAIKDRYSVRTYSKQSINAETKKKILDYANSLNNPFGVKINFKFIEKSASDNAEKLGTYGFIKGADLFIGATVPKVKCAQEALGYDFEKLILYITSLGLGTCWLGGTFNKSAFAEEMKVKENELFPIVTPVGYPASRLRLTEKVFRRSLKADNRLEWNELFFFNDFKSPLKKEIITDYIQPLEMLRLAPSAKNQQPWRVVFDGKSFHFVQLYSHGDNDGSGQEMHRIDMGIAICHFHLSLTDLNLSGKFEKFETLDFSLPEGATYITSWVTE